MSSTKGVAGNASANPQTPEKRRSHVHQAQGLGALWRGEDMQHCVLPGSGRRDGGMQKPGRGLPAGNKGCGRCADGEIHSGVSATYNVALGEFAVPAV